MIQRRIFTPGRAAEAWLETAYRDSPILLIAPHGGRAGNPGGKLLNPKVNDLYTDDMTRELARKLGASALVNHGMDRNRIDLNRISQLNEHAPSVLGLIADLLEWIIGNHERATVLLIHGWNIIQPRLDFGLGLRAAGDALRPPGKARVSASDEFINGPVADLAARLRAEGIEPSFGLRYPGGGRENLLQAFTPRFAQSPVEGLSRLAAAASDHRIDAAQLELSVALRMAGRFRAGCLDAIARSFGNGSRPPRTSTRPLKVVRGSARRGAASREPSTRSSVPSRIGVELFDPAARTGILASFDLGQGRAGARIMVLLEHNRVALFTAEGESSLAGRRLSLGPLALEFSRGVLELSFAGPAVIVPDARAYLSIERALGSGWLDESMRVAVRMPLDDELFPPGYASIGRELSAGNRLKTASFGTFEGEIAVDRAPRILKGVARAGMSFTTLGPQSFLSRRMVWVCFPDGEATGALELREVETAEKGRSLSARMLARGGWSYLNLVRVELAASSPDQPPGRIGAVFSDAGPSLAPLLGEVRNFIPLSRPGPARRRIYTSLGFATFRFGDRTGAGMFEYSRMSGTRPEGRTASGGGSPPRQSPA